MLERHIHSKPDSRQEAALEWGWEVVPRLGIAGDLVFE